MKTSSSAQNIYALNLEGKIQECRCTVPGNLEQEAFCVAEMYGIEVKLLQNHLKLTCNNILSLKVMFKLHYSSVMPVL